MTMLDAKTIDLHYGAAQALRGVSLQAEVGEVTCVLGRNGVGKTSLLDALAGQQQQLAIGRALVMRPRLLLLDEPTEGIQPSIIKDIGRAITYLRSLKQMAIILVEQYLDFARELGDRFVVMDRGSIVYSAWRDSVDEAALKKAMAL